MTDLVEAGRKGGQASGRARLARIAQTADLDAAIRPIVAGLTRDRIGTELVERAAKLAATILDNPPSIETALEAKQLMEAAALAHKMGRLELGESTANTATFAVPADREARAADLEARLRMLREGDSEVPTTQPPAS